MVPMTPGSMIASVRALASGSASRLICAALPLLPGRGDRGAAAGEQRLVDPALGAVGIAHAPPVVVFLDDFHRQAGLHVEPADRIVDAGSDARVDATGFQADESRQRQAARAARRRPAQPAKPSAGCRGDAGADEHQTEQRRADGQAKRRETRHLSFLSQIRALAIAGSGALFLCLGQTACYTGVTQGPVFSFACLG